MSEAALIASFVDLARQYGGAIRDSDSARANALAPQLWAVQDELRARGRETRLKMRPLLEDRDLLVRHYAAKYLYALCQDRARAILEENAKFAFDPICADARMRLRHIDTGKYQPE